MESFGRVIAILIGLVLLGFALVALGIYAWHARWVPVLVAIVAPFAAKMAFGLMEILLTPLSLPMLHLARRGRTAFSGLLALVLSLILRSVFAAYCAALTLYFLHTPGPPTWLVIVLAVMTASAPFAWASEREPDDDALRNLDVLASLIGPAISGTLLALGVGLTVALLPIVLLFLISALVFVFWWAASGAPLARLEHLAGCQ